LAFSYNYDGDRAFVGWLSRRLATQGIASWFLDDFNSNAILASLSAVDRDERYSEDWRLKKDNWQATYLRQVQKARGVIVIRSTGAQASAGTYGRGMWREADAVEYIRRDNPVRVLTVENPDAGDGPADDSAVELPALVAWARMVVGMPPVARPRISYEQRASFNRKLDTPRGVIYPELFFQTRHTDWYELVRLDLYDAMWFCRRCGLESENYIVGTEVPPQSCPICGFHGYEPGYDPAGSEITRTAPVDGDDHMVATRPSPAELTGMVSEVIKLSQKALSLQAERRHNEAMEVNREMERLARRVGILEQCAHSVHKQGLSLHQSQIFHEATELYEHAERLYREIGDKPRLQNCVGNHGIILAGQGRVESALDLYREQEVICRELRDLTHLEMSLWNQAAVYVNLGQFDAAAVLLAEQESICRELGKGEGLELAAALREQMRVQRNERPSE
jgi:hypothetical protein